ncbi:hypothetical protein [Erythrobacter ani]|uniref:DUF559 domain-containing protein n=1 Tax=Erythrobacter ani TaxID=2827235 RepID=A0ABS6SR75_9SPHN|nr:hypothetical protein [Erythrobacter ani]MBV7267556.1 hypothetical protein [Erythrobacter ani]
MIESSYQIRKSQPQQQADAERQSRHARYVTRMKKAGFKQTTFWVREERMADVKAFIQEVNADPQ